MVVTVNAKECATHDSKPNIVFILADDCTHWDIGCYGSKDSKTPNIYKLASQGIRFSMAYCHAPHCLELFETQVTTLFAMARFFIRMKIWQSKVGQNLLFHSLTARWKTITLPFTIKNQQTIFLKRTNAARSLKPRMCQIALTSTGKTAIKP